MPSTWFQLQYHLIFSTKNRHPLILPDLEPDLYAYCGGILRNLGGTLLAIGGVADHVHLLAGLKPVHSLAGALKELKSGSSRWLHESKGYPEFSWQEGYAAITVSPSDSRPISRYIQTQKEHHRSRSFREELIGLLKMNGIDYDERFLD